MLVQAVGFPSSSSLFSASESASLPSFEPFPSLRCHFISWAPPLLPPASGSVSTPHPGVPHLQLPTCFHVESDLTAPHCLGLQLPGAASCVCLFPSENYRRANAVLPTTLKPSGFQQPLTVRSSSRPLGRRGGPPGRGGLGRSVLG